MAVFKHVYHNKEPPISLPIQSKLQVLPLWFTVKGKVAYVIDSWFQLLNFPFAKFVTFISPDLWLL